jgi:hypothetical protein
MVATAEAHEIGSFLIGGRAARIGKARGGRSAFRARALAIALLAAAGGLVPAAGQEGEAPQGTPLRLLLTEGIGYETETAEPGTIVVRELLSASLGRLSGSADLSSAIGAATGSYSALLDAAGLRIAYRVLGEEPNGIFLDARLRYRELFEGARELRFGGTARGLWGPDAGAEGFFGDWAIGYEEIRITIDGLPIALLGGNPLLRLDAGWRFSSRWAADAAVEFFSDEDAGYFPRTLFDFGSRLDLAALSLQCRLVIKYTDFPTPTGYVDGYALRVAATIPLKGA